MIRQMPQLSNNIKKYRKHHQIKLVHQLWEVFLSNTKNKSKYNNSLKTLIYHQEGSIIMINH
jgi:hypothetical protein